MPLPPFATSDDERVVAGVCAGIARALAVDVTLVRLVFALLALAGGAGIVLYLALWAYGSSERAVVGRAARARRRLASLLGASGSPTRRRRDRARRRRAARSPGDRAASFRPDAPLSYGGIALAGAGASCCCSGRRRDDDAARARRVAGALLLVAGPWLWRLALDRDAERAARIRSEERSEVAARVHDSVLQTLALIQRHAQEPRRVASLARRQERELRGWLYGDRPLGDEASLVGALSAAAADVEELHGIRVELASAGDCPADERARARRARGDDERGEVRRGRGDRRLRGGDRRRGRACSSATAAPASTAQPCRPTGAASPSRSRAGSSAPAGRATITSAPGQGTEVELRLPRSAREAARRARRRPRALPRGRARASSATRSTSSARRRASPRPSR